MKTIYDVMVCPHCGGNNCYEFSTDEIEFGHKTGHYYVDCHCNDCNKGFRLYIEFNYEVTNASARV